MALPRPSGHGAPETKTPIFSLGNRFGYSFVNERLERVKGIEPSSSAWKIVGKLNDFNESCVKWKHKTVLNSPIFATDNETVRSATDRCGHSRAGRGAVHSINSGLTHCKKSARSVGITEWQMRFAESDHQIRQQKPRHPCFSLAAQTD